MLLKLLEQVGSMIKMLRLSQVNNFYSVKFAKQIKLNCEIISFLQGQRLFWAYENIPSCLLNFYTTGPFFLCKFFVLLSICYIFLQNMSIVFEYANVNEIEHNLRIHMCAKFRKSFLFAISLHLKVSLLTWCHAVSLFTSFILHVLDTFTYKKKIYKTRFEAPFRLPFPFNWLIQSAVSWI